MAAAPTSAWSHFFPPKPVFTDKDVPADLGGKVYFISGANSGMGAELARMLYSKSAKVYVACRSEEKGKKAIEDIHAAVPKSKGKLVFLLLDQADLAKTKAAAQRFLAQETRLDVLFNNAGVMTGDSNPAKKTVQGHELALGVNCIGALLLTKLLTPVLKATAQNEQPNAERGIDMSNLDYHFPKPGIDRYGISKAADWLLSVECARRYKADGIASVPINTGNAATGLPRHQGCALKLIARAVCYLAIYGVYTQLFAEFFPEISKVDWTSHWVIPWGRLTALRSDLPVAAKLKEEGGNGNAKEFWGWNEEHVKEYL